MKVRSVDVGRVWDCMLCTCVSEEGGDGEGEISEAPSLLSYTLRYVSLAELGHVPWNLLVLFFIFIFFEGRDEFNRREVCECEGCV
jgi:hypothetical protein